MGKLSDILADGGFADFNNSWNLTEAAGEFEPLPAGKYVCRLESGELDNSSKGTPCYKLTFLVLKGPDDGTDYNGRKLFHDLWLTPAALPMSKRDLAKLGIDSPERMEQPLPPGIRCLVRVALRRGDDRLAHNRVRSFEVTGIDPPEPDAFAPAELGSQPPAVPATDPPADYSDVGLKQPPAEGGDAISRTQQPLDLEGGRDAPF